MALLHMLLANNPNLVVCHYNHAWSPEESKAAQWVVDYSKGLGLQVLYEENTTGDMTETGNRKLRYGFFERACKSVQATKLYMAHHMDDQVETIIFRLARGTGVDGLAGIPASRELYPGCELVRPLMNHTKQDLEAYCGANNIPVYLDLSNNDTSRDRNFIRHEIVPMLVKLHPMAKKSIVKLGKIAQQDSQVIDLLLGNLLKGLDYRDLPNGWSIDRSEFLALAPILRDRVWMKLDKGPLTSRRLEIVRESLVKLTTRSLKGEWVISHTKDRVVMTKKG